MTPTAMPSRPCKWPTCTVYLAAGGAGAGRYCPAHEAQGRRDAARGSRAYDATRDPDAKRFYNSAAWRRTRAQVLAAEPVCRRCAGAWAAHVHHVEPVLDNPARRLDPSNLVPLCAPCHNAVEAEAAKTKTGGPS